MIWHPIRWGLEFIVEAVVGANPHLHFFQEVVSLLIFGNSAHYRIPQRN